MNAVLKPPSADLNGRLWGERPRDWADLMESMIRPLYCAAFDRVGIDQGVRYLDVGCGAGLAAQMAAQRGADVSGLDAAQPLLEIARARSPQSDFRIGDLESLPFDDRSFDLVSGFNSFQYAANPTVALSEARRVARPGARILIATWGRPEHMEAASLVTALRPLMPTPPPGAPGPFALSDEATLRAFAVSAGLRTGDLLDVETPWRFATLALALRGLKSTGVAARAIAHSGETAVDDAHRQALAPFRQTDGSYQASATFRYLITEI